jgi:hypothetical protein
MEATYSSLKGSALFKRDSIVIELAFGLIKFTNLQNIVSDFLFQLESEQWRWPVFLSQPR